MTYHQRVMIIQALRFGNADIGFLEGDTGPAMDWMARIRSIGSRC